MICEEHSQKTYLLEYVTVQAKISLLCTSDFTNLKDHTFRKENKAETFSNNEGIFDLHVLQLLTSYVAPNKYF